MAVNRAGICLEVSNTKHRPGISQFLNLNFCRLRTSLAPWKCQDSFDPQTQAWQELSRCLLRARVPSFGSSETTQIAGVLLMTRLGWTRIFSTLATSCLMSNLFDLSVLVSRSTQGVPDLHVSFTRKKKWVVTPSKKIWSQIVHGELWLWFPSTKTGNIAWASLTAVAAVSDSGSSKRWTKMWVKVSLRGPSTIISPWLHGLAHSANTWNEKKNGISKTKCS